MLIIIPIVELFRMSNILPANASAFDGSMNIDFAFLLLPLLVVEEGEEEDIAR